MNNPFISGLSTAIKRKRTEDVILFSDNEQSNEKRTEDLILFSDDEQSNDELSIDDISIDEDSISHGEDESEGYDLYGDDEEVLTKEKTKKKVPVHTWEYTVLPEDARTRDRISDIERRDEEDGFDPDAPCELCRLVDESAEVYPKSLQEYYDYEKLQSTRVPPERLHELLKVKFNDLCYELDQDTGGKAHVKKMTMSGIRRHREETMALPHHVVDLVTEQIDYLRNLLKHIRFSEMLQNSYVDGNFSGTTLHHGGSTHYARIWKLLKEAIELREKLMSNRGGNGAGGKASFKGKASFAHLSFKSC